MLSNALDQFIEKGKFENNYNLEEYGVTLVDQNDQLTVDKLNWKGEAKKSGIQMGDIISNFKIENPERPNKAIVYPFALIFLFDCSPKTQRIASATFDLPEPFGPMIAVVPEVKSNS